jgi:hypothetical protein
MRNSFLIPICFVLHSIVWVAFVIYIPGSWSVNCAKTKLAVSTNSRAILRNKLITDARYRTAHTRKARCNAVVRRLACPVARKLSFSVVPRVALPFPQFAQLHSVTCVRLRLITILGILRCGYQFPRCAPANLETSCLLEISDFSRKLRLRCGCQFPWCALGLTEMSTRNHPGGVKGCRRVRLTTSPPSVADFLENVGASTSHNPMGLHGLLQV